jgi:ketosteroid isomerase-like protein
MKTKAKQNIATVKRFYRALANGDQDSARTFLDPNIEWMEPADDLFFSGRRWGRQPVFDEVIEPIHDKIREFQFKPKKFLAVGGLVFVLGHETGCGRVTDLKLDAPTVHFWTLDNGKAVRFEAFHDTLEWQVVLGITAMQSQRLAA